jgi:hypothetical protein
MANFGVCFNFMMDAEDSARAFKTVPDTAPEGVQGPCYAIGGINSGAWPSEFAAINALPAGAARGPLVMAFYQDHFWNTWFDQLASTTLAERVFDESVNTGEGVAIKILQKAINALGNVPAVTVDGEWGPKTLAAANNSGAIGLIQAFIAARVAYYREIYAAHPGRFTPGILAAWIARAER